MPDAPDPGPYDHLLLAGADTGVDVEPGIYRVVGTGDPLALVRVGDADGRRRTTGTVVRVDRDALAEFAPAENPDGNRPASEKATGALNSLGWQFRAFVAGLRARPLAALVALAVLTAGYAGEGRLPGPEWVSTALVIVGAVSLAYVGSRSG